MSACSARYSLTTSLISWSLSFPAIAASCVNAASVCVSVDGMHGLTPGLLEKMAFALSGLARVVGCLSVHAGTVARASRVHQIKGLMTVKRSSITTRAACLRYTACRSSLAKPPQQ